MPVTGDDIVWQTQIRLVGSNYLRLHFTGIENPDDVGLKISIMNGALTEVETIDLSVLGQNEYWTDIIPGQIAVIRARSDVVPTNVKFMLKEVSYQRVMGGAVGGSGPNDLQPIADVDADGPIWKASLSVAKLYFENNGPKICTGFLISANLLMTNEHCVNTPSICASTRAVFGYQHNADGVLLNNPDEPMFPQFHCQTIVSQDAGLDYAILRMDGNPGDVWGSLKMSTTSVSTGDALYVIQHPWGAPKHISLKDCKVGISPAPGRGGINNDFGHFCDTLSGSSGSPVLNLNHEVVGIHHWDTGEPPFWEQNRAVGIHKIFAHAAVGGITVSP